MLTGSTNFEATNPASAQIRLLINKKVALNGQKIQGNSEFIVSELVVRSGENTASCKSMSTQCDS